MTGDRRRRRGWSVNWRWLVDRAVAVDRRWLKVGGGVALLVLIGVGARPILQRIDWFRVRRVDLVGATYLQADEVARAMRLRKGASIFDDTEPLAARVLAMPGVRRAAVGRRLPGALVVEVEEFEPVALASIQGRLALVDRRGRVLPFDPTRAPTNLPLAAPDPAVTGLIESIKDGDPDLFSEVVAASRERSTIVVETASQRILFRVGAGPKDVSALTVVRAEIGRRGMGVAELDARFDGRVVVRRRRS